MANIKDESKENKDSEDIEPNFEAVRLVHYFLCTVNIQGLIKQVSFET
jgi:hypothetical protein